MSEYDKPIDFDKDVIMKYDRNLVDDEKYINDRSNMSNNKINNEYNIKLDQDEYNPLFTPEITIATQKNF